MIKNIMHAHFKNVTQGHGAMREAMDKQRLQDSLRIMESVTGTSYTGERRGKPVKSLGHQVRLTTRSPHKSLFLRHINQNIWQHNS